MVDLRTLVASLNGAPFPTSGRVVKPAPVKAPKPPRVRKTRDPLMGLQVLAAFRKLQPCTITALRKETGASQPTIYKVLREHAQQTGKQAQGHFGRAAMLWGLKPC